MEFYLKTQSNKEWTSLVKTTRDAAVFLDSKAGECIHWSIGPSALLSHGALVFYDFSSYQFFSRSGTPNPEKAVFISACPIAEIMVDMCDILSQSQFKEVVLILSPIADPVNSISKLKQDLLGWMEIGTRGTVKDLNVEIICSPYFFAPLTETVVAFPPFRDVPLYPEFNKLSSLGNKCQTFSSKENAIVEHVALCLDALLNQVLASDTIFSLGPLSDAVGAALESLPSTQPRRKVSQHRISVVLIDRSLDLCTPTSVDSKSFLDKVLGALPHLPDHSIDVAINMSPLAQVTVDSAQEESLFPGCLAQHTIDCFDIIDTLIHKKKNDILLELHQTLRSKVPGSKLSTRIRPEGLEKDVCQFRGDYKKIYDLCGILQDKCVLIIACIDKVGQKDQKYYGFLPCYVLQMVALAVVQTLIGEHVEEVELLLSTERVLRQNIAAALDEKELTGVLPQVTKLVAERHIRGLSLDSLLTLLVLVYSLIGSEKQFPIKEEVQLQAAISSAIYEDQEYPGVIHATLTPLESSREKIDSMTASVFATLKTVSHSRRNLTKYKSILRSQGAAFPLEHEPLLQQLLNDILDPSGPAMPDLLCHSTGLKDLLKSGFSMLLNKHTTLTSHHPSQQPNLFLLVLGGITGEEIKTIEEAWAASPNGKSGGALLIGSTTLLSPTDTLKAVLRSTEIV